MLHMYLHIPVAKEVLYRTTLLTQRQTKNNYQEENSNGKKEQNLQTFLWIENQLATGKK